MSNADEKAHGVSTDAVQNTADSSPPNSANENESSGGFILLFFIVGFALSMAVGWVIFPKLLYSQKNQPINFNHALHVEMVENGCESCHFLRDDGSFSGIPKNEQCIECHAEIQGESEDETTFVNEYVLTEREVPWLSYSRQPDCVFFSHAAHINGAKLDCVTCHGHIGESESTRPYEQNRITGYSRDIWGKNIAGIKKNSWDRMKMDDCAECHAQSAALKHASSVQTGKDACFVCHK
ncbi:MAG: cytochrome c3 family protein [Desulfobacteraceae bacterium]|jgi:hypothetical protein